MKKPLILSMLALVCLNGVNGQNPNPSPTLDAYIQDEMNTQNFPGVSTVIVKEGKIVWVESYGFADIENNIPVENTTAFLLASISKLFVGTAVMQLFENGDIDLDEDINNHLDIAIDVPGFETDSITFRKLMTHTASIEDNGAAMNSYYGYPDPTISLEDCILSYFPTSGADYNAVNNYHNNAPGSYYDYSNMGTALNGYLVEAISGQPFSEFTDSSIFEPLCMENTAWFMADFDSINVARPYQYTSGNYVPYNHYGFADYPDGQLRSNVMDLANFMIAILDNGNFGESALLSVPSINDMLTIQNPGLSTSQGLNWYQELIYFNGGSSSTMLWGHSGGESGVNTNMYLDTANNIGICVLTNGEGDGLWICDELYDYALNLTPLATLTPSCLTVDIKDNQNSDIVVYPNPVIDELNIRVPSNFSDAQVLLLDIQGNLIGDLTLSGQETKFDLPELSAGVYILILKSKAQRKRLKIFVE